MSKHVEDLMQALLNYAVEEGQVEANDMINNCVIGFVMTSPISKQEKYRCVKIGHGSALEAAGLGEYIHETYLGKIFNS